MEDQEGTILSSHNDKEQLLWQDFKERLGKTELTRFAIDPSSLLERRDDLNFLEEPFSNNEIDTVTKGLPNDKSPGPDGFNNKFLKSCRATIKGDFYKIVQ